MTRREWSPVRDAVRATLEQEPRSVDALVRALEASEAGVRRALRRLRADGCVVPVGRERRHTPRRGVPAVLWGVAP